MTDTIDEVEDVETEPTDVIETPEGDEESQDTFPREYVEKLRDESAKYRQRAAQTDELAARLHTALVTATGRLADASDLPFDEAHLTDEEALTAAIDSLLATKPHLASRRPVGNIGQGASAGADTFSLGGLLRSTAG